MSGLRATPLVFCVVAACAGDRTPRPPKVDDPEDQATLAKLAPYIDCLETHTGPVFELADLVRSRARLQAPAVPRHAAPDPKKCLEGVDAAGHRPPALVALETRGVAFARALARVYALSVEADPTGGASSPRPGLLDALEAFDRAQGELFDEVRRRNLEVHANQLARREAKDGPTLALRVERALLQAERMIAAAVTTWDRLDRLDLATLARDQLELENLAEDMASRALAEPKEVEGFEGYYNVERRLHALLAATRQLVHRARERVAYSNAERIMIAAQNDADVIGTPASVVRAYNDLVDTFGVR